MLTRNAVEKSNLNKSVIEKIQSTRISEERLETQEIETDKKKETRHHKTKSQGLIPSVLTNETISSQNKISSSKRVPIVTSSNEKRNIKIGKTSLEHDFKIIVPDSIEENRFSKKNALLLLRTINEHKLVNGVLQEKENTIDSSILKVNNALKSNQNIIEDDCGFMSSRTCNY